MICCAGMLNSFTVKVAYFCVNEGFCNCNWLRYFVPDKYLFLNSRRNSVRFIRRGWEFPSVASTRFVFFTVKPEVSATVPADTEDSRPEPVPRSKPLSTSPKPPLVSRTSGLLSPTPPKPSSPAVPGEENSLSSCVWFTTSCWKTDQLSVSQMTPWIQRGSRLPKHHCLPPA